MRVSSATWKRLDFSLLYPFRACSINATARPLLPYTCMTPSYLVNVLMISSLRKTLCTKVVVSMTWGGGPIFVGVGIDQEVCYIASSQTAHIVQLLEKSHMADAKSVITPTETSAIVIFRNAEKAGKQDELDMADSHIASSLAHSCTLPIVLALKLWLLWGW